MCHFLTIFSLYHLMRFCCNTFILRTVVSYHSKHICMWKYIQCHYLKMLLMIFKLLNLIVFIIYFCMINHHIYPVRKLLLATDGLVSYNHDIQVVVDFMSAYKILLRLTKIQSSCVPLIVNIVAVRTRDITCFLIHGQHYNNHKMAL